MPRSPRRRSPSHSTRNASQSSRKSSRREVSRSRSRSPRRVESSRRAFVSEGQKSSRSRSPKPSISRKVKSRSPSPSSHSSSSSSSEDSEERRQRRKDKKRRKKEKKRRKKEKKKAKKTKKCAVTDQWGMYGIIKEFDIYRKQEEFSAWLYEIKKIQREDLSRDKERELFAEYMEDYNTATLPHTKFYNFAKFESGEMLLKRTNKPADNQQTSSSSMRDEDAVHLKRKQEQEQASMSTEKMRVRALMQTLQKAKGSKEFDEIRDRVIGIKRSNMM